MGVEVGQNSRSRDLEATLSALHNGQTAMDVKMFLLVRHLVEFHFATFDRTQEGLLRSMYSKMVEEIVPLTKKLAATFVVARENLRVPTACTGATVFQNWELSGRWDVNFIFKLRQIHVLSMSDMEGDIFHDLESASHSSNYALAHRNMILALWLVLWKYTLRRDFPLLWDRFSIGGHALIIITLRKGLEVSDNLDYWLRRGLSHARS
jgi:hypothetical protein